MSLLCYVLFSFFGGWDILVYHYLSTLYGDPFFEYPTLFVFSLLVNRRLSGVAAAHQTLRQVHSAHASLHGSREDMALAGIYPNHPYSDSESNIYMLSDEVS